MAATRDAGLLRTARIRETIQAGPGRLLMRLADPRIASCTQPGQFVHIRIPSCSLDPLLRRPFSVCSVDTSEGVFCILVQVVGRGTELLARLRPGDPIDVLGPLGRGFAMPPEGSRSALVAGGFGIAPLVLLSHALAGAGMAFSFVIGARSRGDLVGLDLLPAEAGTAGCETAIVTEDGSFGERGVVTDALRSRLEEGDLACVYACGPPAMLREVARLGRLHDVPIQVSLEGRMACGFGACRGCVVQAKTRPGEPERHLRVCADGPVFWASEVDLDDRP